MTDLPSHKIRIVNRIDMVDAAEWNQCANPTFSETSISSEYNPFISHEFLNALELSGSATLDTGWLPHHIILESDKNKLLGAVPLYLKNHSQGEYVFDYGWADAFERAGGAYYPKLQGSVPFTPVTGKRILVAPGPHEDKWARQLIAAAIKLVGSYDSSSLHFTFLEKKQWDLLAKAGFLQRVDQQFHWVNDGYFDFEDFLKSLSAKKRKNIRRERKEALANDIEIELLSGEQIKEYHWDIFFEFYMDTGSRKWGNPYLTRSFFSFVGETMPDDILLILAKRDNGYIAGALNFIGGDTLYGRYWGCLETHPFLHFEICYYQAIEYAINNGLKRVEAGAQGEHKLARGYLPNYTYSAHWIANDSFREAVSKFLIHETQLVAEDKLILNTHSPFRKPTF